MQSIVLCGSSNQVSLALNKLPNFEVLNWGGKPYYKRNNICDNVVYYKCINYRIALDIPPCFRVTTYGRSPMDATMEQYRHRLGSHSWFLIKEPSQTLFFKFRILKNKLGKPNRIRSWMYGNLRLDPKRYLKLLGRYLALLSRKKESRKTLNIKSRVKTLREIFSQTWLDICWTI